MSSKSKKTTRVATPTIAAPQNAGECNALIYRIGLAQRQRQRIETAMNDELAAVRERHEAEAAVWTEELKVLCERVQSYCEAHRGELTEGGKRKFFRFGSGEVQWRMRPPSVSVRAVDAVIASLKKLGLGHFVRVREEIDKEAVLRWPDVAQQVKGLTIGQREDFVVKPWDTELEQVL
jgi:phage host-nuclease inhibitor protein Gam